MKVIVDALPLLGEASIATYLRQLLLHLDKEDSRNQFELLFRSFRAETRKKVAQFRADPLYSKFSARSLPVPDSVLEWFWTRHSSRIPFFETWLGDPDLFLSTIYLAPVLKKGANVMIAYDLIPLKFPQFYGNDQPLLEKRIRKGVERARAIIAISECTRRDFIEMVGADPSRIHVVYPGCEERFSPTVDQKNLEKVIARYQLRPPYVLYVGSLGPHKNVARLVRAFRRLKQRHRLPHQLVLCGKAKWGPEVVAEARDLISSGECVVVDFIANDDIPFFYHGAEALAFLSLYEGFGLPPLEAMACGVPVIVSDAASLPEVVGDAGIKVPPTDEEAIEKGLLQILTDRPLREKLKEKGFQQAARFNWPESAKKILKLFQEVLV